MYEYIAINLMLYQEKNKVSCISFTFFISARASAIIFPDCETIVLAIFEPIRSEHNEESQLLSAQKRKDRLVLITIYFLIAFLTTLNIIKNV